MVVVISKRVTWCCFSLHDARAHTRTSPVLMLFNLQHAGHNAIEQLKHHIHLKKPIKYAGKLTSRIYKIMHIDSKLISLHIVIPLRVVCAHFFT